ncbi:LuxR family transcriptional regulator [Marinosulfonomonas sp. PRT-SC04]|nr:LuxR family transcriptional regulator [Marinosulfonomonas sp. PRT-SC04]
MITDYLEQIFELDTIEDIWTLHTTTMKTYGFDRLLYAYTRFKNEKLMANPLDSLVLSSHNPAYVDGFIQEGHYLNGPMLRWSHENDGACSWSWVQEQLRANKFTAGELKALEYNRKMDVTAGYSIGFKSDSTRARGGLGMTAKIGISQGEVDVIWKQHGREILMASNVMHLKVISLPYNNLRCNLTRRQRQVLEWVGDGKTMQDIATIMGLTSATVEKHLRLAREALDVDTTAQAVLKASFQNQIFIFEA